MLNFCVHDAILFFKNVSTQKDVLDILGVGLSPNTLNTLQQIDMMEKILNAETVTMNITQQGSEATQAYKRRKVQGCSVDPEYVAVVL